MTCRVVITGMGGITSLGNTWEEISANIKRGVTGIKKMEEWEDIVGLKTKLAAPIPSFKTPKHFKRKQLRGAGRVSKLALAATYAALKDARLIDAAAIQSFDSGVSYGSSSGSIDAISDFGQLRTTRSTLGINSTTYAKIMPHTTAANISIVFQTRGRIIPCSSACTSGSAAIGFAYETIKYGAQKLMIAGGADELDVGTAAVFDSVYATSTLNDQPHTTPKPFDRNRDGLVVGEGSASLVLEELDHALERGAPIKAEVIGFGMSSNGYHIMLPRLETMEVAINKALEDAKVSPAEIGYISAHATATEAGDLVESDLIADTLGSNIPVSSLKGYFGHTLGACGSLEAWLAINGLNEGWFPPTQNLIDVDPRCADLDYIIGEPRAIDCEMFISNNFAFGGMNTSLIIGKYTD